MRTKHVQHQLDKFPVYSAAFVSPNEVALGGGGGASKTGVKNKVRIYSVSDDAKKLDLVSELQLGVGEDTPMSMAASLETKEVVCGIGSAPDAIAKGANQNCRLVQFDSTTNTIQIAATRQTISSRDPEAYQRVVAFSPDCAFVVTGSTSNEVAVLSFPSLAPACDPLTISDGELYDITVSDSWLVVASTTHLHVYSWAARSSSPAVDKGTKSKKSKAKKSASSKSDAGIVLDLAQKVGLPTWAGKGSTFRAARFSPTNPSCLYMIVNTATPAGRKFARKSFVCRYQLGDDASKWQREAGKRALGDKNVSCFDVSASGKLIAFGSSDCAIGVIDAQSFAPLLTILRAHEFPATTIRFNPTSTLLLSGSADDSVRVVPIPDSTGSNTGSWILLVLAILAILLAIFARVFFDAPLLGST
ncbi:WD40 repeat-like protein [Auricularia subglabra TFB-10046 SS5]|nr:WD40 repeat-like protein [Auricularia subglabra TFB-10046 SS5]